jgi:hypothetical protein
METPKLVIKVETEQQEELLQLVIPARMMGRFMTLVGQQLAALAIPPECAVAHDPTQPHNQQSLSHK